MSRAGELHRRSALRCPICLVSVMRWRGYWSLLLRISAISNGHFDTAELTLEGQPDG